ncbi:RNA polymerase sigma factor [Nonomuraea ferruginea]|uniref:RNA polymerase sigma-70 region 2 domain-containing protein n=2 Tax=Nonomuraea ferruginea TaxID=46174 RepID=A0ABT4SRC8_9ACTN|nr:sigma factor [Nonomuraea ferruginea]MDA0639610.1 hypothetical protein [Nonomuraea ferruginea]
MYPTCPEHLGPDSFPATCNTAQGAGHLPRCPALSRGDFVTHRDRFEAIYDAYYPAIHQYAARRTGSADDTADVISETFLTAWPDGERGCCGCTAWPRGAGAGLLGGADQRADRQAVRRPSTPTRRSPSTSPATISP